MTAHMEAATQGCAVPATVWEHVLSRTAFLSWVEGTITDAAFVYYWSRVSSTLLEVAECVVALRGGGLL